MYKTKKQGIKQWLVILILAIPILVTACSGAPKVDWELSISGNVETPTIYTYDELAAMEIVDLDDVLMEKSMGPDEVRSFSGIDLLTLLEEVGVAEDFSTITGMAADGYAIEISRDEMVNGIVAIKQNGDWIVEIDPDEGPIRLVFPSTPANRWVFQLTEIIVN